MFVSKPDLKSGICMSPIAVKSIYEANLYSLSCYRYIYVKSKSVGQPLWCRTFTNGHIALDLEILYEFPSTTSYAALQSSLCWPFQCIFYIYEFIALTRCKQLQFFLRFISTGQFIDRSCDCIMNGTYYWNIISGSLWKESTNEEIIIKVWMTGLQHTEVSWHHTGPLTWKTV